MKRQLWLWCLRLGIVLTVFWFPLALGLVIVIMCLWILYGG